MQCYVLREISWKGKVERPSQCHAQFFPEGRQLREVDCPPQPPRDKTGDAQPKNFSHTGVMANGCELTESRKTEGRWLGAANRSNHILRATHRFAQRVLRGWRMRLAGAGIWNRCAIANRPHARKARHFQRLVNYDASPFFFNR